MPSTEAKFAAHVRRYRDQTRNLRQSLKKKNLVRNPERLDGLFKKPPDLVASTCPFESGEETFEWSYDIKDLALTLSGLRHPQPPGAVLGPSGLLSCKITEFFAPQRAGGVAGIVPIKSVELNFVVDAKLQSDGGEHPLRACWHIDTHPDDGAADDQDDDAGAGRPDNHSLHPLFHYQFGGRHLRPSGPIVRGVLVLDVPRIAIPPLDLNLAIDFVVGNYLGNNWKALRQDTQYAHPMRESMRRIWAPYYDCIAGHFVAGHPLKKHAVTFLPDLL